MTTAADTSRSDDHTPTRASSEGRSDSLSDLLTWRLPVVVALSCAAIGMPLLDLYGSNPTVFVSAELTTGQIVVFGLLAVLVPAIVASLIEVFAWLLWKPWVKGVHTALVGFFSVILALSILRKAAPDIGLVALLLALAFGALIAYGERSWTPLRTGLRFAAILPLVVWFLFFFTSPTSRLFEGEASAVNLDGDGQAATEAPSVVFIILDEFPLLSLMGTDGNVRDDLYPNFARLQDEATWYRNTTSNAPGTELSVPSLTSGLLPRPGAVGSSIDWPNNLFTLLGDRYEVEAQEEATRLCPVSVCGSTHAQEGSLSSTIRDATVVYGHLISPSNWRDSLPAIDEAWGEFGDVGAAVDAEADSEAGSGEPTDADLRAHEFIEEEGVNNVPEDEQTPERRLARLNAVIGSIDASNPATLYYAHILFPHKPWRTTPQGHLVLEPDRLETGRGKRGDPDFRVWVDDPNMSRIWLQRHLLQVGAADQALGDLMARLDDEGLWDDSLVVVTADHGTSFTPGMPQRGFRGADGYDEMYRVPLFIKAPGQKEGEIVDEPAQSIDIIPTIVDLLELDVDWDFDGRSLLQDPPDDLERQVFHYEGTATLPNGVESLFEAIDARAELFSGGSGWMSVAAVGPLGRHVGRQVDEVDLEVLEDVTYEVDQNGELGNVDLSAGAEIPLVLTGTIELPAWDGGRELLLVVNGTVAGVGHLQDQGPNTFSWAGLIAEELLVEGRNEVELLVPR